MKQYLGSSNQERDPQGVTSAQPPQPSSQKTVSNRKAEAQKKNKANKPNEPREHRSWPRGYTEKHGPEI